MQQYLGFRFTCAKGTRTLDLLSAKPPPLQALRSESSGRGLPGYRRGESAAVAAYAQRRAATAQRRVARRGHYEHGLPRYGHDESATGVASPATSAAGALRRGLPLLWAR